MQQTPADVQHYKDNPDPRFHRINADYPGLQAVHADPWVFLVRDMLTAEECDALVDKAKPHLKPTRTSGGLRPDRRTSLSTRCWAGAQHKMANLTNLPISHFEGLKVIHYQQGGFFKRHHDSYDGAFGGQAMGHRIMTAFMCAHAAPRVNDCLSD